jgi:Tfp pilus assembly protein PilN
MMKKLSHSYQLFYAVLVLFLLFAGCFVLYQQSRERTYRIDLLQSQLQDFNRQVSYSLQDDSIIHPDRRQQATLKKLIGRQNRNGLRLTLILTDGRVVFDSFNDNLRLYSNHLDRTEVRQALGFGEGFDIRRQSATFGIPYYYSATYDAPYPVIVRSALPYNTELIHTLQPDTRFLLFAIGISIVLIILFYFVLRKMRSSISQKENLLTHLRISREGLAVFDERRNIIMSNSIFEDYSRQINGKKLDCQEDILDVPEMSPILTFLEQYHTRTFIDNEPTTTIYVQKGDRLYSIACAIFFDHSFEISICDGCSTTSFHT